MSYLFTALAIVLSDIMCFAVAYNYRGMLCGIEHEGYSAPASIAFIYAIPFLIGIVACVILVIKFRKKKKEIDDLNLPCSVKEVLLLIVEMLCMPRQE